jgi:hypothetical protein
MIQRSFAAILVAFVASAGLVAQAQAPVAKGTSGKSSAQIPRTLDGHPDFRGSWTTETYTPFERPAEFKDREFFTEAEAEAYAKRSLERFLDQPDTDAHYDNAIWMTEKGPKPMSTLRTSIVSTPDGRIPPVNEVGRKRAEARAAARRGIGQYDSAQTRGISERCIYWGHEGPPLLPTGYNNNLQIIQSPGEFVIIPEMMPVARIAPFDGRAHLAASIRNIRGDSRARWEGDTLAIESTNFTDRTAFRGSSENLKVTERLTFVDADTIRYQFTIEDPQTWDTAWTGEYPIKRTTFPMYEYACHEGNYGMANILRGVRAEEEKARQGTAAKQP